MLVYANRLDFCGAGAEEAIFNAIGDWLSEHLGFLLHPDQLRQGNEFNGTRSNTHSRLRIITAQEEEPRFYVWTLKRDDEVVPGRHWITELGLMIRQSTLAFSCVLRTDEQSTLVPKPTTVSLPPVIRHIIDNIQQCADARFTSWVPGIETSFVDGSTESCQGLLKDIRRSDRIYPIILVSPTTDHEYPLSIPNLQQDVVGLAQVVQITPGADRYGMESVLGKHGAPWGGEINILYIPSSNGFIRGRYFNLETVEKWGASQDQRIGHLLTWVTNNTNVPRMRSGIRAEGVMQVALRRRLLAARAGNAQMGIAKLRQELESVWELAEEQSTWTGTLESEVERLESRLLEAEDAREEAREEARKKEFTVQSLKDQLAQTGGGRASAIDVEGLLDLACRADQPTPVECLDIIESIYGDRCVILGSARDSSRDMNRFAHGRRLLDMLIRLVTDYRSKMIEGGDNVARKVFGRQEYASAESYTVAGNSELRRRRTFEYRGTEVEMMRHLKIGVADDASKTIRVYFHWDSENKVIVIGYCGEHLPVSRS